MRTFMVALVLAVQFATIANAAQPNMAQRKAKVVERAKQKKIMREREKFAKQVYAWLTHYNLPAGKNWRWKHKDAMVVVYAIMAGVQWDIVVDAIIVKGTTKLPWREVFPVVWLRRQDPARYVEYMQQVRQTYALQKQAKYLRAIDHTLRLMGEVFERELGDINDNLEDIKDWIPPPRIPRLPTVRDNAPM